MFSVHSWLVESQRIKGGILVLWVERGVWLQHCIPFCASPLAWQQGFRCVRTLSNFRKLSSSSGSKHCFGVTGSSDVTATWDQRVPHQVQGNPALDEWHRCCIITGHWVSGQSLHCWVCSSSVVITWFLMMVIGAWGHSLQQELSSAQSNFASIQRIWTVILAAK